MSLWLALSIDGFVDNVYLLLCLYFVKIWLLFVHILVDNLNLKRVGLIIMANAQILLPSLVAFWLCNIMFSWNYFHGIAFSLHGMVFSRMSLLISSCYLSTILLLIFILHTWEINLWFMRHFLLYYSFNIILNPFSGEF